MAPPNYYFPGVTAGQLVKADKPAPEILGPRNLVDTFADVTSVERQCTAVDLAGIGPDGTGGCLLCAHRADGQKPPRVGQYKAEHQDWTEVQEKEATYWIGLDKHLACGPEDLVRAGPDPFDRGYWVELAGDRWFIPVIRDVEGGTGLPQDWQLEPDGTLRTTIQSTYQRLWRDFAALVDLLFDPNRQEQMSIDPAEAMARCLDGLSLRYRIGRGLLNRLRLINSQTWFGVLAAMIDLRTFWDVWTESAPAHAKKNSPPEDPAPEGESPPIGPGVSGSDPTTDPAGEN